MRQDNNQQIKIRNLKHPLIFSFCNLLYVFSASILTQIFYLLSKKIKQTFLKSKTYKEQIYRNNQKWYSPS